MLAASFWVGWQTGATTRVQTLALHIGDLIFDKATTGIRCPRPAFLLFHVFDTVARRSSSFSASANLVLNNPPLWKTNRWTTFHVLRLLNQLHHSSHTGGKPWNYRAPSQHTKGPCDIDALADLVFDLQAEVRRLTNAAPTENWQPAAHDPPSAPSDDMRQVCYYHQRWDDRGVSCQPPCKRRQSKSILKKP